MLLNEFLLGDRRATLMPALALLHLIVYRFHNYIAEELYKINTHWNDEKLFQESRRILTAVYQNIAFNEWLPYFLGKSVQVLKILFNF